MHVYAHMHTIRHPPTHTIHTPVLCVCTLHCVMCVGVTWLSHVMVVTCVCISCVCFCCVCVKGDGTSNGGGDARIRMASREYSLRRQHLGAGLCYRCESVHVCFCPFREWQSLSPLYSLLPPLLTSPLLSPPATPFLSCTLLTLS